MKNLSVPSEYTDLELQELVKFALGYYREEIKRKNLRVDFQVHTYIPTFKGAFNEVNLLFSSLIKNIINYAEPYSFLDISIRYSDSYIMVEIKGAGTELSRLLFLDDSSRSSNDLNNNLNLAVNNIENFDSLLNIIDSYSGKIETNAEGCNKLCMRIFLPAVSIF